MKVVFIGDEATGKTCQLISYSYNTFPVEYIPKVFSNYIANINFNSKYYSVDLWDTAGPDDFDKLRPLSYTDTDVFVICYDIMTENSLENIKSKWITEITYHCPKTPYIIVANKIDLREDEDFIKKMKEKGKTMVTYEAGYNFAMRNGSKYYCECSAKTQKGLKNVYETIIKVYEEKNTKKEKKNIHCFRQLITMIFLMILIK
jgi:small GTP-binding protein